MSHYMSTDEKIDIMSGRAEQELAEKKLQIALEDMECVAKQPLPEIERFPVHYYEEGIQAFETALQIRQLIALQHWLGNTGYTFFDVFQSMQDSM